jgi:hypothetical protein
MNCNVQEPGNVDGSGPVLRWRTNFVFGNYKPVQSRSIRGEKEDRLNALKSASQFNLTETIEWWKQVVLHSSKN